MDNIVIFEKVILFLERKGYKGFSSIETDFGLGKGYFASAKQKNTKIGLDVILLIAKKYPDFTFDYLLDRQEESKIDPILNSKDKEIIGNSIKVLSKLL